ncbi:uncharacterized protein LOC130898544 isoform X2 [Diorhabda carinulata]|uniref:uncharacterized protein LOC130898544 isoform X2 n=1 Tax=Diorhabda carinulata TaxID=1163345 RepID=UPI0025A04899|nr:uncharacterized protein LOC130898544 isoform X2 [Diorhabda carinulata]
MAQRNFQWDYGESKWTKIIIPSGTVDPNQSTVIQIPEDLQHTEVIIARSPGANGQDRTNGGGGVGGGGGGGKPCPSTSRGQAGGASQQGSYAPPSPGQTFSSPPPSSRSQNVPTPGPGDDEDTNMLELTTPNEADIIKFVRECDHQRARLLVMPINKKMRLMEQMEYIETGVVRRDLKEFQETRRKLVFDLQSLFAALPNVKQTVKGVALGKP